MDEMEMMQRKILEEANRVPVNPNSVTFDPTAKPNLDGLKQILSSGIISINEAEVAAVEERKRQEALKKQQSIPPVASPGPVPVTNSVGPVEKPVDLSSEVAKPAPAPVAIEFQDGGMEYKVENGVVYKKEWTKISSERSDLRIIRHDSKKGFDKIVSDDNFWIEELVWKKIGQ